MFEYLNKKSRNLEERLFTTVLFVSFLSILLFTLNAIFIIGDPPIIITNSIITFIIGGMLFAVRYKAMYRQIIMPYGLTVIIGLNLVWFISGGYDSPNGYILLGILIVVIIVSQHKYAKILTIASVINVIILFCIEYYNPEIVIEYPKKTDIISQGIIFIFIIVIVNYIIAQLKKSYDDEREKVSEINKDLTQKNIEIESKSEIINSQNKELKSYSDELEKKVEKRTHQLSILNKNLKKQNQTLEQFTFITAHNLRSPIAQIRGLINLMPEELLNNKIAKETYSRLQDSATKLDEVVSDITMILNVRDESTKLELTNLKDQLDLSISTLSNEIKDKNAKIQFSGNANVQIAGIHAYIQSIFYNLIHNSIKYAAKDRDLIIHIDIFEVIDKVQIIFKDNGIGIDMKYAREKIFKLYQRFNTEYQGKGFGLFLTKTQVESMNGEISVNSKPNEGTTFILSFPKP